VEAVALLSPDVTHPSSIM